MPGEDPFLSGQYAINFVKGMQEAPEDPYHLQASACCKHFVANELESWNGRYEHEEEAQNGWMVSSPFALKLSYFFWLQQYGTQLPFYPSH